MPGPDDEKGPAEAAPEVAPARRVQASAPTRKSSPRPPRTSVLAIASLILAVLFLPLGLGAFLGAGCTRGCEAGGAVYVRPGEEMPRELGSVATRLAALGTAAPEGFAFLLAWAARRGIRRSGGRIGGADVAVVAMGVAILSLLMFLPAFTCGWRLLGG